MHEYTSNEIIKIEINIPLASRIISKYDFVFHGPLIPNLQASAAITCIPIPEKNAEKEISNHNYIPFYGLN